MRTHVQRIKALIAPLAIAALGLTLAGCPAPGPLPPGNGGPGGGDPNDGDQAQYDKGFDDGFAMDEWYWDAYFDGWFMVDHTPIYYDDSEIPFVEDPPYDAGYWDGVWYAYQDGYFVDYHYAFVIGFSEGYDNAFWPDYLDFLANDQHIEYYHGGWIDGYDDGFSEGRVFGANDFEQGLPFDWLDALWDYQSGTDLYFEEVDVGTGSWGPVVLYEWGVNPNAAKSSSAARLRAARPAPAIRTPGKQSELTDDSLYRPLRDDAQEELSVTPSMSLRSDRELGLESSWLDRINTYNAPAKARATDDPPRARAVASDS